MHLDVGHALGGPGDGVRGDDANELGVAVGVVVRVEAAFDLAPVHKLDTLFVRRAVPDVALHRRHQVLALVVGPRGQEVHIRKYLVVILCT
jgi:hypothetical protein